MGDVQCFPRYPYADIRGNRGKLSRRATGLRPGFALCNLADGGQYLMATATAPRDLTSKPTTSEFSRALVNQRNKFNTSRYKVADHCGVSVSKVEEWERGTAVPDHATFKRLCGMFRQLIATPPPWGEVIHRPVATIGEKVIADIRRQVEKEPEPMQTIESFGTGLKRHRLANKMKPAELGHLLGLGDSAVYNWEADANGPSGESVAKLYEALPELEADIKAGRVQAPKHKPKVKQSAPALVIVEQPKPEPVNTNVTPAVVMPDVEALAAAYGKARALRLRKMRERDELRGRIADLDLELANLKEQEDQALAALDRVAAEPGK